MQTYLVVWHAPLQKGGAGVTRGQGYARWNGGADLGHLPSEEEFVIVELMLVLGSCSCFYFLLESASVTPLRSFLFRQIGPDLP